MTNRAAAVRAVVYAGVLYAAFADNVFCVPDGVFTARDGFRAGYVGYDSDLVVNRLAAARDGCHPLHPLYWHDHHAGTGGRAYTSQFGLQGVALGAIYARSGGDAEAFAGAAGAALAGATAALLAAFFASAARRVGPTAADGAVLLTSCSPILLPFAPSLYWVPALMLAPFVAVWLLYPRCGGSRPRLAGLFGLVAALTCAKCLCGYEYVSTVVLAPVAAVVYHRAAAGGGVRTWVGPAAAVVAAGAVGFAAALVLHVWQIDHVVGGDGWAIIGGRAAGVSVRGGADPALGYACLAPDPAFLPEPARLRVRSVANYFWLPAVGTPTTWGPLRAVAPLGVVVLAAGVLALARRRRPAPPAVAALTPAAGVALLGGLSWHVLALNHTCNHPHLNLVCYAVPFLPLAYLSLGWEAERLAGRLSWVRFVPWVLAVATVCGNLAAEARREPDEVTHRRAAEAVAAVLRGERTADAAPASAYNPTVRLDAAPRTLRSELWFHCRVRPDFNGRGGPCRLVSGWAVGPPAGESGPTVRVVAVAGGRVLPAAAGYTRIMLLERILRGKATSTFFALAVPDDEVPPGERVRVFAVSGPGGATVAELPPVPDPK